LAVQFLLEQYVTSVDAATVERRAHDAREAAAELTRQGKRVEYLRSIFVPEDETCFHLYEAESLSAVREAARRAALPFDRVAEAVLDPAHQTEKERTR
jgi:hypothetical protein